MRSKPQLHVLGNQVIAAGFAMVGIDTLRKLDGHLPRHDRLGRLSPQERDRVIVKTIHRLIGSGEIRPVRIGDEIGIE